MDALPDTYCLTGTGSEPAAHTEPVAPAGTTEAELICRACVDGEAFGELYRRHYAVIGSYLLRRTGCRHTTEDLLAEVFLSAMRALPSYRWRGIPFRHWLYRIATRAANRHARKKRPEPLDQPTTLVDPQSESHGPEDGRDVSVALQRLSPAHQAVLTLHHLEGLAIEEVARILRVRVGTVKSRLARAREALRERLAGDAS